MALTTLNPNMLGADANGISQLTTAGGSLILTANGNVGIGTNLSSGKLHVKGGNALTLLLDNDGSQFTELSFRNNGSAKANMYWDNSANSFFAGTDVAYPFIFKTNASERMRIDSSGNIGIGVVPSTISAGVKAIQIGTGSADGFFYGLGGNDTEITTNAYFNSGYKYQTSSIAATRYFQSGGIHAWSYAPANTAGNAIAFTEAMRIDSSGNVGIGTSSPFSAAGFGALTINGTSGGLTSYYVNGTETGRVQVISGALSLSAVGASNVMQFNVNGAERMRIDTIGNLLVGTTVSPVTGRTNGVQAGANGFKFRSPAGNNEWGINLTSGTLAYLYSDNGTAYVYAGSISLNGNTAAYNSVSDYRLKENIIPMTGALDKVAQLKPVTFTFKNDGQVSQGFIAHELQAVIPEAVTGEKDAVKEDGTPKYQGVDTSFLVATLTAAIQEQQAIIQQLKTDFEEYKASHP